MPDAAAHPTAPAAGLSTDRVLILDFGSQFTQLIARRLRENGVYCEIWPYNTDPVRIRTFAPRAIILSGGPASVPEGNSPRAPQEVFDAGVPVLGICYGQMAMCEQLGGEVDTSDHREFGRAFVDVLEPCALFRGVWGPGAREQVWMSHGDRVTRLPPGFRVVATSEGAPFAAFADDNRRFYGLMFHPEVMHTPHGAQLLRNFTHDVAGCAGTWTMGGFRDAEIARIREQVGSGRVICGLSGGVDSSVAAVLIHEAIGDQLTCIFVDHGLLRAGGEGGERPRPLQHPPGASRRVRHVPRRAGGHHRPGNQAQDHRPPVHRGVRGRSGQEDWRRGFPGAGHAVSGCDREREFHRRPQRDDQVAPQCRRSARADAHAAGGAAARIVQGRGAQAGRELDIPESIVGRHHPFPGGSAIRITAYHRREARSAAAPIRSISRRSGRPGCTTRSGRLSWCCCRCAPSA